jgi:antitoxin Phd
MQTYLETQENLSALLERAREQGEVRIKRANGEVFILKSEKKTGSAFEVAGVDLGVSTKEIVEVVREGRERL